MPAEESSLYAAFKAKDARFDGRFFVGISSTGIYCRPVCKARQPKIENCTFYPTAAEAEQAGYRPCLLCRPEIAPGTSITDATKALVQRAARLLEENCGSGENLDEFAARLGCTGRHLRRVFAAEYNVSPVQYLQTCRLLLAKNLLTDTNLSVLDVAMASGFGSLRRFNDLFKSHYHLSPTDLRKRMSREKRQSGEITLSLGYRPPYEWERMLRFLSQCAIPGVELVQNGEYLRTACLPHANKNPVYGWVRVGHKPKKNALAVTVSETLLPVLPQVLARVRHLFDLYCDPETIEETLASMNDVKPGLYVPGTRLPGCFDAFEMAVRAVLGRQAAARFGTPVETGIEGLTHIFPSPEDILALEGPVAGHLITIRDLARALRHGDIVFDFPASPEAEMKKLLAIPGMGSWAAQYIAMRAMGWTDAFLETAEAWRPWRSYATINLWHARSELEGI